MKKQRGASFASWMMFAATVTFVLVTVAKIAPVYMEYATVKSMVDKITAETTLSPQTGTRQLRRKLDDYMNINGLYTVQPEYFSIVDMPDEKNAKGLQVKYEVRKHWLANIDFVMNFEHTAKLTRQN